MSVGRQNGTRAMWMKWKEMTCTRWMCWMDARACLCLFLSLLLFLCLLLLLIVCLCLFLFVRLSVLFVVCMRRSLVVLSCVPPVV